MANFETRISRLELSGEGGARVIVVSGGGDVDALLTGKGIAPRPNDLIIAISKPEGCSAWVSVDGVRCG